jgi:hypothetical protein
MADPWSFFVAWQVWCSASLRRKPPGSTLESPWQGDSFGVRHSFLIARVEVA